MGAAGLSKANLYGGGNDFLRSQLLQKKAHGGNICQSVHGADLVKVNFRHGNAVDMTFRLGDFFIDGHDVSLHALGDVQSISQGLNVRHGAVVVPVVVVMFMVVVVMRVALFLAVNQHPHMGAADAALGAVLRLENHPRQPQAVQLLQSPGPVRHQLIKGGGEHIPGSAHS